jgi:hypothetical protein
VRNGYTLKIANRTFADHRFEIVFSGIEGVRLSQPGRAAGASIGVVVPADQVVAVRVFVTAPPNDLRPASLPGRFVVRSGDIESSAKTVFLSGAANQ